MEFRWIFMPYCLQRLQDGRYIVLNRSYKPLGWQSQAWVDYDTHPSAAPIKITAAIAKKLSWQGNEALDVIHLYNDTTVPTRSAEAWDAYQQRLAILANLKIRPHIQRISRA